MKQRQVGLRKAEQAKEIVDVVLSVTGGDLLHAAVCMNNDVRKLVTYDKDFNKMDETDNTKAM
jgi:predicted nucleic acid-binding protein